MRTKLRNKSMRKKVSVKSYAQKGKFKKVCWMAVIEIFLKMARKSYLPQMVRRLTRER